MDVIISMNMYTEGRNAPSSDQSGQAIVTKPSNQLQLIIEPLSTGLDIINIFISKAEILIGKLRVTAKHDASTNNSLRC
jgi:hypothetical protein